MRVIVRAFMHLVPPQRRGDPTDSRRSILLIVMMLLVIVTNPIAALEQARAGEWVLFSISVGTGLLFAALLLYYRLVGNHRVASRVLLTVGLGGIVAAAWSSGGIQGPVAPLLVAVPLAAIVQLSGREAGVWTLLTALVAAGLFMLHLFGVVPPTSYGAAESLNHYAINLMMLLGYVAGFVWFMQWVTVRQVREIEHQRRAAHAASEAKSAFLANMSHELRTPMNGVLGMTQVVLADPALPEEDRRSLQTALESGLALVKLLDDILALSEERTTMDDMRLVDWHPRPVLDEVLALFVAEASEKGLDLRGQVEEAVPESLVGEVSRVRHILVNLVGNAVRFTEQGSVELRIGLRGSRLVFEVEDTGPGIRAADIERLFLPFEQADVSATRRHGGSGLGLPLARRFARQLDGDVRVRSTPGQGSCFTLELPVTSPSGPASRRPGEADQSRAA